MPDNQISWTSWYRRTMNVCPFVASNGPPAVCRYWP